MSSILSKHLDLSCFLDRKIGNSVGNLTVFQTDVLGPHMAAWCVDNILLKDCVIWYTASGIPLLNIISAPIMSSDVAACLLFL